MRSLSKAYRCKQIITLINLSKMLKKDWRDLTQEDVDIIVTKIVQIYGDQKGQETNSTTDYKKYLKMFYRWVVFGTTEFREVGDPPETKSVRIRRVPDKLVRENLVTSEDLEKLIHCCRNLRDKAMLAVQADAGIRPGELLSLKIKHVKTDDIGMVIAVDGKTGARSVRLIKSVPYLSSWINEHPFRDNHESPLWIQLEGKHYGDSLNCYAARQALLEITRRAQMSKRIFLNLFRHSESTELANFMTEAQLRKRHGWSPSSKMPARYVHLINQDVEDALLDHYGIKKKKEQTQSDLPIKCSIWTC